MEKFNWNPTMSPDGNRHLFAFLFGWSSPNSVQICSTFRTETWIWSSEEKILESNIHPKNIFLAKLTNNFFKTYFKSWLTLEKTRMTWGLKWYFLKFTSVHVVTIMVSLSDRLPVFYVHSIHKPGSKNGKAGWYLWQVSQKVNCWQYIKYKSSLRNIKGPIL